MGSYYVDSCIYLNLWKKEVDEKGIKLEIKADAGVIHNLDFEEFFFQ